MNTWTERQLGELIHIKHGFAFSGDYIVDYDNGVVLVTPGNFKIGGGFKHSGKKFFSGEIPDDYILQGNALIVTMTDLSKNADTLGYAAYVPNDEKTYLHNQRIGLVSIISDDINESFLYWLLRTPWYQRRIANTCNGANVKHTSPDRIYKYKFLLPTLSEQKNIAKILSAYDNLIEANNRRIELLEQAAQELYKEWFVRFRFPGYENTKFESGLPEGWVFCRLGKIMSFGAGKTRPESGETYPVYGGNGILDYCNYYNNENAIIIGRVGAYCGTVYYEPDKCWISDNALFAESKNDASFYNYYLLKNMNLNARQVGTGQPLITQGLLNRIKILLPPEPVVKKFNEISSELLKQQHTLRKQNTNLAAQRDMLLPRLMSGKLEVN